MKFEKNKEYKLQYIELVPLKAWRGTDIITEIKSVIIKANFEYIGNKGKKLHFFSNQLGKDLFLSKQEAIKNLINK